MKKVILSICLQILFFISTQAQVTMRPSSIFITIPDVINTINCSTEPLTGCNYIFNPELSHTSYYNGDPYLAFNNGFIGSWTNSHGTPNLEVAPPIPPSPAVHAAYMAFDNIVGGEGIAGKIKKLTPNNRYGLSFFETVDGLSTANSNEYNIYLMHCSDAPNVFHPMTYVVPVPPLHSQQIYCQKNFNLIAGGFEQVAINFVPNEDYDMIWIFPNVTAGAGSVPLSVGFAYPEIVNTQSFTAGPPPLPSIGNCTVHIGPSTPNCGVKNAVYTWHDPSGNIRQQSTTNQVFIPGIDTSPGSPDIGVWTLEMTVPTTSYGTNYCSSILNVQAHVTVPPCPTTCVLVVTPVGPIDYYTVLDDASTITLTSSYATGNQWYHNGTLMPGETAQTLIVGYPYSDIFNSNTYYSILGTCQSNTVTLNHRIYGYGLYGEDNFTLGAKIYPVATSSFFCFSTTNNPIKQFDMGTSAKYNWYVSSVGSPMFIITPGSSSLHSYQAQIDVSNLTSYISGIRGVADLSGQQKIIDYHLLSYVGVFNTSTCPTTTVNINATSISEYGSIKPGGTDFDWEDYDLGPNSTITFPTDPSLFINPHKLHIPGRNPLVSPIQAKFSATSTITRDFYYNGSFGGCHHETINMSVGSCKSSDNITTTNALIYPNPANSQITITSRDELITSIEIIDLFNPTIKKIISTNPLRSLNVGIQELQVGIYNCKITTTKGTEYRKLIIKR